MTREPMQEKLIELLGGFSTPVTINGEKLTDWYIPMKQLREKLADHLIANGVRLEEKQATSNRENLDVHSRLMGLLQRAPYIGCADTDRQYAVNWLMNNGVTIQKQDGCKYCEDYEDLPEHFVGGTPVGKVFDTIIQTDKDGLWHLEVPYNAGIGIRFCPMCGRKLPEPPKGE